MAVDIFRQLFHEFGFFAIQDTLEQRAQFGQGFPLGLFAEKIDHGIGCAAVGVPDLFRQLVKLDQQGVDLMLLVAFGAIFPTLFLKICS